MNVRLDDRLVALRRWFHQHPELSFAEAEIAKRIITELNEPGIRYDYAVVCRS
jgi:metal-dependent amidase/aminoacylase/carboxypeptidase family protein